MTTPVGSTSSLFGTNNSTSATTAAAPAGQALDENAFLKLLMAQMQNQDPLAPSDSTQFVTQLAQFTQVQQSTAQTTSLSNISSQLQALGSSQATDLIGKTVTVNGTAIQWNGSVATPATVSLDGNAVGVTAQIQDSSGNTVRTLAMGTAPAGMLSIPWDGKTDSGTAAPSGAYSVVVTASGANGAAVHASTMSTGTVTQVSFNQGSPTLTLSNGAVAAVSQLAGVGSAGTTTSTP